MIPRGLRIENIVQDKFGIHEVLELLTGTVRCQNINKNESPFICLYSKINGVLLSEKWLLNFGFKEIKGGFYFEKFRKHRIDIYKMSYGRFPFYFRYNQTEKNIKYVHELQNLYYFLTGEELKIIKR